MPRRAAATRREVQADAVYNNRLVTQLINKVLLDGKKATAENIDTGFEYSDHNPVKLTFTLV